MANFKCWKAPRASTHPINTPFQQERHYQHICPRGCVQGWTWWGLDHIQWSYCCVCSASNSKFLGTPGPHCCNKNSPFTQHLIKKKKAFGWSTPNIKSTGWNPSELVKVQLPKIQKLIQDLIFWAKFGKFLKSCSDNQKERVTWQEVIPTDRNGSLHFQCLGLIRNTRHTQKDTLTLRLDEGRFSTVKNPHTLLMSKPKAWPTVSG